MKRKPVVVSLIGIILVFILVILLVFRIQPASYSDEMVAAEVRNLRTIERLVSSGSNPESVDLAIGLSEDGLSKALEALQGVTATSEAIDGLVLKIIRSRIEIEPGYIQVFLSINASREGLPIDATLNARGVFLVHSMDFGSSGSDLPQVHYRIGIREIGVELGTGIFSLQTRHWVNDLISSNLTKTFVESLQFSMPLHFPTDFELGFSREESQSLDDGHFTIRYSMPESRLADRQAVRLVPGIPTRDGLWFLASITADEDSGTSREDFLDENEPSKSQLERLRSRVAEMVAGFPNLDNDVAVYANAKLFDAAVNAFNELTPDQRRINAQLISREGKLIEEIDKVDLVGEGGYYVDFRSDESLTGSAQLSKLRSTWTEESGLTLSGHIDVKAEADFNLHIDPYIGGGFNTSIGINGSTKVPLKLRLDARHIDSDDGSTAVVIGPVIECRSFPIELRNSGLVPFGVITHEFIGDEQPKPQIIISSDVIWTQIVAKGQEGALIFDSSYWAGLHVIPVSVMTGASGYRFFANIDPSVSVGVPPETQSNPAQRKSIEEAWKREVQPSCPEEKDVVFLFAGEDFGPNNEIVKALRAIADSVGKAGEILKISWDRVETVVKSPKEAPRIAGEVINDTVEEGKRVLKKAKRVLKKAKRVLKRIFGW